jgi:hypothetical protein
LPKTKFLLASLTDTLLSRITSTSSSAA